VWAAYLELDRTPWLDPTAIEQGQLGQVRRLLAHCIKNVPYYRELLAAHGIVSDHIRTMDDFRRIPILQRRAYREQFSLMQAGSLPEGTRPTGKIETSRTSGMPIEVLQTNVVQLWWLAFFLRDLQWCGIDPPGTLAAIRPARASGPMRQRLLDGVSLPHWGALLHAVIETGVSYAMDIHQDPRRQLQWLYQMEPDYVLSYASNLEFLGSPPERSQAS
jgi:phenylacetate-coenzyme A ligase PaaK-like adenylate-forming protein